MKNKIWTSIKKHQNEIRFIIIIMLFGLFSGIYFYLKQDLTVKSSLSLDMINVFSNNVFSLKNIFYHLIILIFIILSSFILLGLPFVIIYIFMESLAVGFLIPLFFSSFKLSGIGIFIMYFTFIKLIFFLLLIVFFIVVLNLVKSFLYFLKNRKNRFNTSLKKVLVVLGIIILNDILIYFIANKILNFILV